MLQVNVSTQRNTPASKWVSSSQWMAAAPFEAPSLSLSLSIFLWFSQTAISTTDPRFYSAGIVSRCHRSPGRIKRWLRPRDHNLRAGIISSEALAHSIHVGSLPGLFLMRGRGWTAGARFQGQGSADKRWRIPLRTHLSVGADALWNGRSRRVRIPGAVAWLWLHLSRPRTLSGFQTQPWTAAAGRRPRPQNTPVEAGRARARRTGLAVGGSRRS